jgi:hypothetical protein
MTQSLSRQQLSELSRDRLGDRVSVDVSLPETKGKKFRVDAKTGVRIYLVVIDPSKREVTAFPSNRSPDQPYKQYVLTSTKEKGLSTLTDGTIRVGEAFSLCKRDGEGRVQECVQFEVGGLYELAEHDVEAPIMLA